VVTKKVLLVVEMLTGTSVGRNGFLVHWDPVVNFATAISRFCSYYTLMSLDVDLSTIVIDANLCFDSNHIVLQMSDSR